MLLAYTRTMTVIHIKNSSRMQPVFPSFATYSPEFFLNHFLQKSLFDAAGDANIFCESSNWAFTPLHQLVEYFFEYYDHFVPGYEPCLILRLSRVTWRLARPRHSLRFLLQSKDSMSRKKQGLVRVQSLGEIEKPQLSRELHFAEDILRNCLIDRDWGSPKVLFFEQHEQFEFKSTELRFFLQNPKF